MAEEAISFALTPPATTGQTKHVTCRYFKRGACKEGNKCRYSHDLANSKPTDRICKFFQRGNCAFGDRCWFEHCELPKDDDLPTTSHRNRTLAEPSDAQPSGSTSGQGEQRWFSAAERDPGQSFCGQPATMESSIPLDDDSDAELCDEGKQQLCWCDAPSTLPQRSEHNKACVEAHDEDEGPFNIEDSKNMICGVCSEVVLDKENPEERRFGILTNCSHCYCMTCIGKWRRTPHNGRRFKRSCPECRIPSKLCIPSDYWVEDEDRKQKLVQRFMDSMRNKPCRHFDEGRGRCRFGSKCYYKHAFPNGRLEEARPRRRRRRYNRRTRDLRHTPMWDLFDELESLDIFDELDSEDNMTGMLEGMMHDLSSLFLTLVVANIETPSTEFEDD